MINKIVNSKSAFTLAEVLITLGIIGIVAALMLPAILANVSELVNSHREANIALKVTKALEKMQALGLLDGSYKSTDEFVDVLQKHLNITKRCDAEHIKECWPTDKVINGDKDEYEVRKAKKGINLHLPDNQTDNVGLILADGAMLILTYNENAAPIEAASPIIASYKALPVGMGKLKEFAYTSSSAANIDFVMDVNGAKGPNSETIDGSFKDIRSFRAAKFSEGCPGIYYKGNKTCWVDLGTNYAPIDTCQDKTWDRYGAENTYCSNNYWAGAKKACADLGMSLPNFSGYNHNCIYNNNWAYCEMPTLFEEFPRGCYWERAQYASTSFCQSSPVGGMANQAKNKNLPVMCVMSLK